MDSIAVSECGQKSNQVTFGEFWQAGQIVSLWDMLFRFHIQNLLIAHETVTGMIAALEREPSGKLNLEDGKTHVKVIAQIKEALKYPGLEGIGEAFESIEHCMQSVDDAVVHLRYWRELKTILSYEMSSAQCYLLLRTDVWHTRPEAVHDLLRVGLPQCVFDLEEANKCLAFGRNTACVYHCMCSLDRVLPVVYKRLKTLGAVYKDDDTLDKTWTYILNVLEKELKRLETTKKTDKTKKELKRLSVLCNHMRSVKSAWRNDTMHAKGQFTDEIAKDILGQSNIFLKYVADTFLKQRTKKS